MEFGSFIRIWTMGITKLIINPKSDSEFLIDFVLILEGTKIFPPAWVRLRIHYEVESPMEYLEKRYSALT